MLSKQILQRIEDLTVRLERKNPDGHGIPVTEEAQLLWYECQAVCRKATENNLDPEEAFCQLFFKAAGEALARDGNNHDLLDLKNVKQMAESIRERLEL